MPKHKKGKKKGGGRGGLLLGTVTINFSRGGKLNRGGKELRHSYEERGEHIHDHERPEGLGIVKKKLQ